MITAAGGITDVGSPDIGMPAGGVTGNGVVGGITGSGDGGTGVCSAMKIGSGAVGTTGSTCVGVSPGVWPGDGWDHSDGGSAPAD